MISRAASSTCGTSSSSDATSAACSASASAVDTGSGSDPLVGDRGGTDDADRVAERGGDDIDLLPGLADRLRANELAHRAEQLLTGAADPAADHDHLRLE